MLQLHHLDRAPDPTTTPGPLGLCLQWLRTLVTSPAVDWDSDQRAAAVGDLQAAEEVMRSDVMVLAGRALPLKRREGSPSQLVAMLMDECGREGRAPTCDDLRALYSECDHAERTAAAAPAWARAAAEYYLVPVHDTDGANWDDLTKGSAEPWPVDAGWNWRRVLVFDAPTVRAHDLATVGAEA